jgi:hypothetical protein
MSEVVAAFCAVLLFSALKDLMEFEAGEDETSGYSDDHTPKMKSVVMAFLRLAIIATLVQCFLVRYRHNEIPMHAWGLIGGIMTAFAGIDAFGMVQQLKPFRNSPLEAFGAWGIAAISWGLLCLLSNCIRKCFMKTAERGQIDHHDLHWHHSCKHCEDEGVGICLGLLMSSIIRFSITGSLPPIDGAPKYKSEKEISEFLGACLFMFIPVFASAGVVGAVEKYRKDRPYLCRAVGVVSEIIAMTWGWCFVFLARWIFWSSDYVKGVGLGNKMAARVTCALLGSVFGGLIIYMADFMADRLGTSRAAFDSNIDAVVRGIARGWEGAF